MWASQERLKAKSVLKIRHGVIVRGKEQQLGALIVNAHRAGSVEGDNGRNSEGRFTSVKVHVVTGPRFESRRPVDQAISCKVVCVALYISMEPRGLKRRGGIFIVAIDNVWQRSGGGGGNSWQPV